MSQRFTIILIVIGIISFGLPTKAARLYLDPAVSSYRYGSTASMSLRIDTEGECINAIESGIILPRGLFKIKGISTGESILSLWIQEPQIDEAKSTINFIGGIPGGFCDKESSPDKILEFFLQPINENISSYIIEINKNTKVLAHDGFGTPVGVNIENGMINFSGSGDLVVDRWQEKIELDVFPPEEFEIQVVSDSRISQGQYVVVFNTTDKQSGIDHYEVQELDQNGKPIGIHKQSQWLVAKSPYLLLDQSLNSLVRVKAVDNAGNERIAEYSPEGFKLTDSQTLSFKIYILIGLLLVVLLTMLLWLILRRIHNHNT